MPKSTIVQDVVLDACKIIGEMFEEPRIVAEVASDSASGDAYATVAIYLQCQLTATLTQLAELRAASEWVSVDASGPPEDGRFILVCRMFGHISYAPTSARFGTYHPNAKGKETWRDSSGVKIIFTHWQQLPPQPSPASAVKGE